MVSVVPVIVEKQPLTKTNDTKDNTLLLVRAEPVAAPCTAVHCLVAQIHARMGVCSQQQDKKAQI